MGRVAASDCTFCLQITTVILMIVRTTTQVISTWPLAAYSNEYVLAIAKQRRK